MHAIFHMDYFSVVDTIANDFYLFHIEILLILK